MKGYLTTPARFRDLLVSGNGGLQLTVNGQPWFAGGLARLHSKIVIEPRARNTRSRASCRDRP